MKITHILLAFFVCIIGVTSVFGQEIYRRGKLIDSTLIIGVSPIRIKSLDTAGETSGQVLTSNGAGHPAHWTTSPGSNPMTTLGDVIYGGTSGAATRLAGQITTTKKYLSQTGSGSASGTPSWGTVDGIGSAYSFSIGSVTNGRWYSPFGYNGAGTANGDPSDSSNFSTQYIPWIAPKGGGTIKNFTLSTIYCPQGSDSIIITFRKNGVAQTLKATVKGGNWIDTDSTNSISVSYKDRVALFLNVKNTGGNVAGATATWMFYPNFFIHYYTGFREVSKRWEHEIFDEILY